MKKRQERMIEAAKNKQAKIKCKSSGIFFCYKKFE